MKVLSQMLAVFFTLALLGALGVGGYFAIEYIVSLFGSLDVQVARVTSIASAVALLAALIIASNIRQLGRQNKVNQLQPEKAATYKLFLDLWVALLQQRSSLEDRSAPELSEALDHLDHLLALFGGSYVIKAHTALRTSVREDTTQQSEIRSQFINAVIAVRKDLGSDTPGPTAEDLQQLLCPTSERFNSSEASADPQPDRAPAETVS